MANTLITPDWVLREVARGYLNNLTFVANCNRGYDDSFQAGGTKVGEQVKIRLPQRYEVTDGEAFQPQALLDQTVTLRLTNQKNIAFGWSSRERTTDLEAIRERYINPAASRLANAHDVQAFEDTYRDVYNAVGTPGTTPTTNLTYLNAGVKLDDEAVSGVTRNAVLDPAMHAAIANANLTLFNPQSFVSDTFRNGMFGSNALGIDGWFKDQNCPAFTTGSTTSSTPLVDGASQTGNTLLSNGWGSGATTLRKGDILTVAGVYSVNPLSYTSTGRLRQFVVTADISDTAGAIDIPISPSIITSGPLQTVTASPANDAVITYWSMTPGGSLAATVSRQGMVYSKDAFAAAMADLDANLAGAEATRVSSRERNVSIRMVQQYQIGSDQNPSRLDILIGNKTIQARFACRVVG